MFVDASAIVAVLSREPGWEDILVRIDANEEQRYISPLVRFETVQALARKRASSARPTAETITEATAIFDAFVARLRIDEVTVSTQIGGLALRTSGRFGKVVGHPAALNFGDCFAYACAKSLGVSLVYKGNDFALTDLA
jgi:ribonuclease VapC